MTVIYPKKTSNFLNLTNSKRSFINFFSIFKALGQKSFQSENRVETTIPLDSSRFLFEPCSTTGDCIRGKICNKYKICSCDIGFYFDNNKTSCQKSKTKNESCLNANECEKISRLKCISGGFHQKNREFFNTLKKKDSIMR